MSKVKIKIKLYARRGATLLNVTNNRYIITIYSEAYKLIYDEFKKNNLPYKVYVSDEDLRNINKSIYGKGYISGEYCPSIYIYLDQYLAATEPIMVIMDVKNAPEEVEKPDKGGDSKSIGDHDMVICDSIGSTDLCSECGGSKPHYHVSCEPCPVNIKARCKLIK